MPINVEIVVVHRLWQLASVRPSPGEDHAITKEFIETFGCIFHRELSESSEMKELKIVTRGKSGRKDVGPLLPDKFQQSNNGLTHDAYAPGGISQ